MKFTKTILLSGPCIVAMMLVGTLVSVTNITQAQPPPTKSSTNRDLTKLKSPASVTNLKPMVNDSVLIDKFFNALPNWTHSGYSKRRRSRPANTPDSGEQNLGAPTTTTEKGSDNRNYNVIRQRKSIQTTPEDIVTFDPAAGVFYLGNIIQEKGMRAGLGSINPVPNLEGKRSPVRVYMDSPSIPNGSRDVANPSGSNISSAVGELIEQLGNRNVGIGGYNFSYCESASTENNALKMGLDAQYMTYSVKSVLQTKHEANEYSINGVAILKGYTIAVEPKKSGWKGFFNDKFTYKDVKSLEASEAMWLGNLPTYVKSVTYGTIVVFNMSKKLTKEELKAKVDAHAGIGAGSVDLNVAYNNMRNDSTTKVTFTTIGGPGEGAIKTATSRDFNNLFGRVPTASEMRPISYTMRSVKENALASMQRTTEYTYTEYAPNPIGQKYRLSIHAKIDASDDGAFDNTLECYGELRINNDLWWAIDRGRAETHKRERGQTLEISADNPPNKRNNFEFDFYYDKNTPFSFSLALTDYDGGSNDDPIGRFSNNLTKSLIENKGSTDVLEYVWNWRSNSNEASTIFVKLEPIGFL
jgi:hypothetical protein